MCTFYIAIIVPYNATFVSAPERGLQNSTEESGADKDADGRASIVSDVIVEMLFIVGERLTYEHFFTTPAIVLCDDDKDESNLSNLALLI